LSLKNCPNFDRQVLAILNITCNPFTLRELYLDGCDSINDDSLEVLSLLPPEKLVVAQEEIYLKNTLVLSDQDYIEIYNLKN
jgi:hypothetical protein